MKIWQTAAIYFMLQGIAVIAWWLVLFFVPAARKYFQLENDSEISLLAFWLADLALLAFGSFAAGWLCFRESRHAPAVMWFVTGAYSYAVFYTLAFALFNDTGWLGVALMFPAMIWSGNYAIALSSIGVLMFRESKESSTSWILSKTFVQIIIVWTLILAVFPYFITVIEDKLGITRLTSPFQKIIAAVIFVGISYIGLKSSYTMSKIGKGTPLPLDATKNLVIAGTYAYVRNPMAISGIGQGIAVALF